MRYAAMLRGVMPTNCRMPELKAAFEAAGFQDVKTVISSGNVVFGTRAASEAAIQAKAEAAMEKRLGRTFLTIVRPIAELRELIEANPWKDFRVPENGKRNVTFLREAPAATVKLPVRAGNAAILARKGREVFSYYVPDGMVAGPDFMAMIEKTFGKAVTTRTWETVMKLCAAGEGIRK